MGNYPGSFGTSTPATELNLRTRELNLLSKKGYALISTVVIADGTTIIDTLQLRK